MADDKDKVEQTGEDEKSLASLIKLAGEQPEIPLGIESRVYNRVQQEWRNSAAQPSGDTSYDKVHKSWRRSARRSNRLRWLVPAAAAAVAVFAVLLSMRPEPTPPLVAATVARVIDAGHVGTLHANGSDVHVGETISTAENEGLSLLLARGESLRIDQRTELRVDGTDRFTLLSGRVYADTGLFLYRDGGLTIDTAFGTVTDVGTQFAVAMSDATLDVAVREGRVDIRTEAEAFAARMGERLVLAAGQSAEVSSLDAHDEYWSWTTDLAPVFDTSNRSLLDFLKWAARETGRELVFDSDATRMFAMQTDVSGSIAGLTPDEALASILSTTSFRFKIETDKVFIARN